MRFIKHCYSFLKYSKNRRLSLAAACYSAYYRICILLIPMKYLEKTMGIQGEESGYELGSERMKYAKKIRIVVNGVCNKTLWDSKCLVKALTARRFLKRKKISSTLYLGCRIENEKLIAHAWLRTGSLYVSGGNGTGYSVVTMFKA